MRLAIKYQTVNINVIMDFFEYQFFFDIITQILSCE